MEQQRSILDRSDLYCPAPKLSGQASYGGKVLLSTFIVCGCALLGFMALAIGMIALLKAIGWTGSTSWLLISVPVATFVLTIWVLSWTYRRRDILVVLWETYKIEKKERRAEDNG
jgi:uncharacterized membrane protein